MLPNNRYPVMFHRAIPAHEQEMKPSEFPSFSFIHANQEEKIQANEEKLESNEVIFINEDAKCQKPDTNFILRR